MTQESFPYFPHYSTARHFFERADSLNFFIFFWQIFVGFESLLYLILGKIYRTTSEDSIWWRKLGQPKVMPLLISDVRSYLNFISLSNLLLKFIHNAHFGLKGPWCLGWLGLVLKVFYLAKVTLLDYFELVGLKLGPWLLAWVLRKKIRSRD